MELPEKLEPGGAIEDKVTSSLINAMLAGIRRAQPPAQIKGGRIQHTDAGWLLSIDPGGLASGSRFPLKPIKTGANKVRFVYGTVHGIVPRIGSDYDSGTDLTGTITDPASPELTVTESGVIYVQVDLAEDTYEAEKPLIAFAANLPGDVPRESAYQILCALTYDSGEITLGTPAHQGSIDMASCGGVMNYWDLG